MEAAGVYLILYLFGANGDPRLLVQPYGDDWNGCRINAGQVLQGGRITKANCVSPGEFKKILKDEFWGDMQVIEREGKDPSYMYFKM